MHDPHRLSSLPASARAACSLAHRALVAGGAAFALLLSTASGAQCMQGGPLPEGAPLSAEAMAAFDRIVLQQLEEWKVPGLALGIVKDGKIVTLKGYGFRNLEQRLPMTADTIVPIASVTKGFTVAALGTLVKEGKLDWDKPVRTYLPEFRLKNDHASLDATPRDLVTHRVGLPRHDLSWYSSDATREELMARIPHLDFSAGLRERYQYNNFMYLAAGYLGGRVAGTSWEALVRKNLFEPLDMKSANFTVADLERCADHGTGYDADGDGRPVPRRYQQLTAMGPTGSINASTRDMANYLAMLVNQGEFGGKTVIAPNDLRDMTRAQIASTAGGIFTRFREFSEVQYAMGMMVTHYRGVRLVGHPGDMPGAHSLVSFLPERNMGIWMHVNGEESFLTVVLSLMLYDRLLGLEPVDWTGRYRAFRQAGKASEKSAADQGFSPRKPGTRPAHDLADYAGRYRHPGYGVVTIETEGEGLRFKFNALSSPLRHFHYEVFEVPANDLDELRRLKTQFVSNLQGDVSAVRIDMEAAVPPIEFERLPDAAFQDKAFLARFAGEYEVGTVVYTVALRKDGALVLAAPNQRERELVGIRGQRFAIAGGESQVEFISDAAGKVNQMAIHGTGASVAGRKRA